MKPRKSVSVYVLLVGVMGLLIVGGIFAFQLIDQATKNQLTTTQKDLVKPLDGKIEENVIKNLLNRKMYSREDLSVVVTPKIEVSITPVATSSSEAAIPNATLTPQ
jgi:hypothetical protein